MDTTIMGCIGFRVYVKALCLCLSSAGLRYVGDIAERNLRKVGGDVLRLKRIVAGLQCLTT